MILDPETDHFAEQVELHISGVLTEEHFKELFHPIWLRQAKSTLDLTVMLGGFQSGPEASFHEPGETVNFVFNAAGSIQTAIRPPRLREGGGIGSGGRIPKSVPGGDRGGPQADRERICGAGVSRAKPGRRHADRAARTVRLAALSRKELLHPAAGDLRPIAGARPAANHAPLTPFDREVREVSMRRATTPISHRSMR
jgi:hypothetical protein